MKILTLLFLSFASYCQNVIIESTAYNTVPVMTAMPTISGTASIGNTLTAATGTWTNTPTSYTYQWKRNNVNISGATSSTYILLDADVANKISVGVTASNASGAGRTSYSTETLIAFPSTAAVGSLFLDNFNRAAPGSNYTTTATDVTFSQNSTFLRSARATTGGFANYIQLLYPSSTQGFSGEVYTLRVRYRIVTTSVGIAIGWKSLSGNNAVDFTAFMSTGASGYGTFYNNGTEVGSRTATLATANGNQVELQFDRSVNAYTVTVKLMDGSGNVTSSKASTYTFVTAPGGASAPGVSQLALYFVGGTYDLEQLELTCGLSKYASIMFMGNSIMQWYQASAYYNRFATKTMANIPGSPPYLIIAGQGQRTTELLLNESEVLYLRPKYIIMEILSNDIGTGIATATWQANYSSLVEFFILNGIKPVLLYVVARNTFDFRPTTTGSPNKWISDTYGSDNRVRIVDTYTPLKDPAGNGINAAYSADGAHPNDLGEFLLTMAIRNTIQNVLGI